MNDMRLLSPEACAGVETVGRALEELTGIVDVAPVVD
jgi:hypothetical protein